MNRLKSSEQQETRWRRTEWRTTVRRALKWTSVALAMSLTVLVVWCLIPIEPTIPPIQPRANTQYWTMSGGYRIAFTHVASARPTGKPPIMFLHGGPGAYVHSSAISVFGQLVELGHDVYLYDQVGSGLSDRLPRPKDISFLGHVRDIHEIVTTHLGAPKVILIGHSYGGKLATQFVATYPELVDRVVLSSPGIIQPTQFTEDGQWTNETKYVPPPSIKFVDIDFVRTDGIRFWPLRVFASVAVGWAFDAKLMSDAEADGILNTLAASHITRNVVCDPSHVLPEEGGAGFYAYAWGNWYGDLDDPRPAIRKVTAPVVVLQGACDYIPYAATYEYVDLMQNARYVFVEGAGHVIWWDRPVEYSEEIVRFLVQDEASDSST